MNRCIFALSLMALMFASVSCTDFKESDSVTYFETIASVNTAGDYPSFKTDEGNTLNCSNIIETDTGSVLKVGERIYIYYTLGDTTGHASKTYPIQLYRFGKAKIKDFVTVKKDSVDSYDNQQIKSIYRFWIGGDYFNMMFYTYSPVTSVNSYELVRMMKNEDNTASDTVPEVSLELRHNTSAINYLSYNLNIFCFDLSPLTTDFPVATKIKINLKWLDVNNGSQTYNFVYVPSVVSLRSASHIMTFPAINGIPPHGL